MAFLLILALAAMPTLSTSAPPDCGVQPLADAEHLSREALFLEAMRKAEALLPSPTPSVMVSRGYVPDVKVGTVAPMGVEIVEPPGCPEISDQYPE
ncbi:hypothetical protein [Nonomuraea africana]|uniref:Uncharacterized protein n=1 Tax=Nonomuraea africana TaxID=46171 RepID=A0ABR9KRT4_9ACTN|nr:hypothetical protein [Nonomuraea africana]MBE1564313.1 hypothetical protein [Nonomuraea africana]